VVVVRILIHVINLEVLALAILANGSMVCDVDHLADESLEVFASAVDLASPVCLQVTRLTADDVDEAVAAHLAHKASISNLRKCT
jgi:hypothetical protein